MSDRDATIVVDVHDALPEVLDRLRFATGRPAVLDVPHGSSLLLTAIEFRALEDAIGRHSIALTVRTDDPLRLQLASMFGLPTTTSDGTSTSARNGVAKSSAPPARAGAAPAAPSLPSITPRSSPVVPKEASASSDVASPNALDESPTFHSRLTAGLSRLRSLPTLSRRAVIFVASAIVVLLIAAVAATILFLPKATVALSLARQPASAELIYAVAAEGAPARSGTGLTIVATPVNVEVVFDHSIPASASRVVPDASATGIVQLVNPTTEAITIEAGTEISVDETMTYVIVEAVEVPPGAPFENRYGQAEVAIRAKAPGAVGNLDIGVLTGQLDSGVYFSNRNAPIAGGTDRTVPVVAAADLERLRANADDALPLLADETLRAQLAAGQQIIAPSRANGEPTYTYDHAEGDAAEFVSIHAVMSVTALAFNPAEALTQAAAAIAERLAAQAPDGFELNRDSIVLSEPSLVAEQSDGAQYGITAEAEIRAVFTDDDREAITRELTGKQPDDAETILRRDPRIERFQVTYTPGWLPDRMPASSGRIDVEIAQ